MTTYRLVTERVAAARPVLDEHQQAVVDHPGGPLLVLAGPGTGKTTTLVEAIARRIDDGADPASILALTFSRKAAEQLRDRVTARVGRTVSTSMSSTFHSFAFGLIRRFAPPELYATPLRLLSAPEQDVVLQDLLTHAPESVRWPDTLREAVGTRGFAREVLDVLARAREKGLGPEELRRIGREEGVAEFEAAGLFLDQYLLNLDLQGATDYADLIQRAVLDAEEHRAELRARFAHVLVDEYQDTDPSQVRLLRALAGDGRDLTVVGDPHQSIYAFRGADVRGILEFPTEFPHADGRPADVVALRTTRRFGPRLLLASQRVAGRLSLPGSIPPEVREAFARPEAAAEDRPGDGVEVVTYDTARAEAEHLADRLRRAHLEDGLPWSQMAVLVRSGRSVLPAVRRSLAAAGVPVEVAADDLPLGQEPAVQPLLTALRLVVHRGIDDPASPHHVDAPTVSGLLTSPLVGLDATELRALARQARLREKAVAAAEERVPRPSDALVRAAVLDPALLEGLTGEAVARTASFARLLVRAREVLEGDGTAEGVLWTLWDGTSWPRLLRSRVEAGGQGARLAHRDLDAVGALFEAAARADEQRGHRAVGEFLATLRAQQIPGDTLAEEGVRGDAVRLLTAHRAKGLEWDLVVVAHVQEEAWPDLRRRASLLAPDRLGGDGLVPPVSTRAMLTEERRLFYVACTRARRTLLVTAVASPDDDGEQPSRFLAELFPPGDERRIRHESGRPRRPLSLAGLVAELRRTVSDPATAEPLRLAAARRLARLATERIGDRSLVPAADPATWWGTRALTASDRPLVAPGRPVPVTASMLSSITECPAKWFLEREAGGARATSASQGFGNVVHAIADGVTRADLGDDTGVVLDPGAGDPVDGLMGLVDDVWRQLTFRTPWSATREREQVRAALARFLDWHRLERGRSVVASEADFRAEVVLPDGEQVLLRGRADRLEVDTDGRVVVIDLKTGKYPLPDKEMVEHPQLGLYQYAVDHGGFADRLGPGAEAGGAELWQLRKGTKALKVQSQEPQRPGESGTLPIEEQLMAAVQVVRKEALEVRPGKVCDHCDFQLLCPAQQSGTVLS
ncbi:ATP-dependent helicase [Nocardioides euryhalodurans]|uniref:DNA 3'-5' helicase n=1 Tax=Nocardioides euryhalodurans TaxID=2518370 RepID=A0A4P7GIS3_9ACTN|nr:ATP-dependent DNA helicase [Nocardioides euryhalodurans]QBR91898.1 ATP-dependent helicase [Nocardioides euryhalodurans]